MVMQLLSRGLLATLALLALPVWAAVSVSVDRNPIVEGETVQLTVEVDGDSRDEPDWTPLETGFRILQRSSGSQFTLSGGQSRRVRTWTLVLAPRRTGQLQIPPLTVGQQRSQPITLQVNARGNAPGQAAPAIVEFSADTTSPHVREQVLLTVRLLVTGTLASGGLSNPAADGAVVEQLGEQRESQTTRDGVRYRVFDRQYVLFPERAGALTVEPPSFTGEIASSRSPRSLFNFGGFGDTRTVVASGDPITLDVRPPPAGAATPWLPASRVELRQSILPAESPVTAGVPFTREIQLIVDGQLHTQLDPLDPAMPAGVQVYPEQPDGETRGGEAGIQGVLTQRWAMIPTQAGPLELPAVIVPWWDRTTQTTRMARIPAQQLQVQPGAARASTPTPVPGQAPPPSATTSSVTAPTTAVSAGPWRTVAWVALAGWLLTALAWVWRSVATRRSRPHAPTAQVQTVRAARKRLAEACHEGDPRRIRRALLDWARCRFERPDIVGPDSLEAALQDAQAPDPVRADLVQQARGLDAALFHRAGDWSADRLLLAVDELARRGTASRDPATMLPPLYPS